MIVGKWTRRGLRRRKVFLWVETPVPTEEDGSVAAAWWSLEYNHRRTYARANQTVLR
jgi:hypothetical protein